MAHKILLPVCPFGQVGILNLFYWDLWGDRVAFDILWIDKNVGKVGEILHHNVISFQLVFAQNHCSVIHCATSHAVSSSEDIPGVN